MLMGSTVSTTVMDKTGDINLVDHITLFLFNTMQIMHNSLVGLALPNPL